MTEPKDTTVSQAPLLKVHWFHAIDRPIVDPIAIRKAKREKTLTNINLASSASSISSESSLSSSSKNKPKNWVPFSKRDNTALEKAFENGTKVVPVNEDHLFQVDIYKREISPVYWEGPVFEVRRATWFMQTDSKWLPCEENMAKQIEQGYHKHKPIKSEPVAAAADMVSIVQQDIEKDIGQADEAPPPKEQDPPSASSSSATTTKPISELKVNEEQKEYLLGPYLGQYVIYTSPTQAWLLYDTAPAKIAKSFLEKLTNNQNLGGIKLLRGYNEVEKETAAKKEQDVKKDAKTTPDEAADANKKLHLDLQDQQQPRLSTDSAGGDLSRNMSPQNKKELEEKEMIQQRAEDYDNEDSEEDVRNIDQIVFVIHGIGQQMSERMGQNFVHDVNVLRKTLKSTWPIAVSGTQPWIGILFGTDDTDPDSKLESDIGISEDDDGCPTLDEITLEGAPNIRTLVSDVFLDIPLYLTSKYHDLMIHVVTKEINRVYKLFIERNPYFLKNNGQVSIVAHSLGSLLGFDILSVQPFTCKQKPHVQQQQNSSAYNEKNLATLNFSVKNYFALGSPLGMIMLLRGNKMVSRKTLTEPPPKQNNHDHPVSFVCPAADNMYNIFHKSDPVAYRLEPLVVRHYGAKLKPVPIPYIKGGLKSMLDAGFNAGSDLANRAGAMFESIKTGFTSSLLMRGLGFSKPLEYAAGAAELQEWQSQTDPNIMATRANAKSASKLKSLNPTGRLDFYLQEGLLENAYLSALSVHMSYWQDVDVAGFLIREIYQNQQQEEKASKTITV
ncbi:DDHD domain-containing protein [Mucor lusitanicus]